MIYEKLPHDIVYIRRKRWKIRLLAMLLALTLSCIFVKLKNFSDFFRAVGGGMSHNQSIFAIISVIYLGFSLSFQETLRNWVYKNFGHFTREDFIEVSEGKYLSKIPAPKIIPVWVMITAKTGPVILVSIIPGFIFCLLGWNVMKLSSILLFFLYLGDIVSSFYYIAFCKMYMIEYFKPGKLFGIAYFDTFFFCQEKIEEARKYIEDSISNLD